MQDRTSANSMKVLLQRAAGPYIGSISTEIVGGDRRAMSGMDLKADVMSAALGDGRGTSGLILAFRLLAIRVTTESTLFLMGCG